MASLWPGICVKYFLSIPQKNLSPEKTETNWVLTFQFLSDEIYSYTKIKPFGTWQFGKIGVLVNFITQKLKSKHLAISVFSGQRFFWGNERKYFPHIPRLTTLNSRPTFSEESFNWIGNSEFHAKAILQVCFTNIWSRLQSM